MNAHWFMSLDDARRKCEAWRRDYNEERPHSAIGNKAPIELIDWSWPALTETLRKKARAKLATLQSRAADAARAAGTSRSVGFPGREKSSVTPR